MGMSEGQLGQKRIERVAGRVGDAEQVRHGDHLAGVAAGHGRRQRGDIDGERNDPGQRGDDQGQAASRGVRGRGPRWRRERGGRRSLPPPSLPRHGHRIRRPPGSWHRSSWPVSGKSLATNRPARDETRQGQCLNATRSPERDSLSSCSPRWRERPRGLGIPPCSEHHADPCRTTKQQWGGEELMIRLRKMRLTLGGQRGFTLIEFLSSWRSSAFSPRSPSRSMPTCRRGLVSPRRRPTRGPSPRLSASSRRIAAPCRTRLRRTIAAATAGQNDAAFGRAARAADQPQGQIGGPFLNALPTPAFRLGWLGHVVQVHDDGCWYVHDLRYG